MKTYISPEIEITVFKSEEILGDSNVYAKQENESPIIFSSIGQIF